MGRLTDEGVGLIALLVHDVDPKDGFAIILTPPDFLDEVNHLAEGLGWQSARVLLETFDGELARLAHSGVVSIHVKEVDRGHEAEFRCSRHNEDVLYADCTGG